MVVAHRNVYLQVGELYKPTTTHATFMLSVIVSAISLPSTMPPCPITQFIQHTCRGLQLLCMVRVHVLLQAAELDKGRKTHMASILYLLVHQFG
jgi:hypothetical protein